MANQLYKGDKPLATFVPQIADNLTTDDSTKALSAKQGKVLNEKIDEVETEVATKVTLKTATGTITTNSVGATNFENIVSNNAKILRVDVLGIQADRMCFLGTWNGNVLGYVFTRDLNPVVNTQLSIRILYYE